MKRTGTVRWFNDNKGYGFIAPDDGSTDVLVRFIVIEGEGFKSLAEDSRVTFESHMGKKGPEGDESLESQSSQRIQSGRRGRQAQ